MQPEERDIKLIELIAVQCGKIERFLSERGTTKERFLKDSDCQDLCALAIIQIGESSNRLSDVFTDRHKEIDWRALYGMRCVLTHDYIRIDPHVFWETVTTDIPVLASFCSDILNRSR